MAGSLGRKPYAIFEIDVPRCPLVYGEGLCTAALSSKTPHKCYNTKFTCQDQDNYDGSNVVTHRYVLNIDGMPKQAGYFPLLQTLSTRAAEVNLSGIDPNSTALGVRASGSASLVDATDNGSFTDPYAAERRTGAAQFDGIGYKPEDRGTHFGKFFSRTPYYEGLACRVKRGYVGDDPDTMPVEHYVVTEAVGPTADGNVTIKYKDVIDLADGDKSVAPALSLGKLLRGIEENEKYLVVTPEGIGDTYAASGLVRVGSEIMAFARTGDKFRIYRGKEGTTRSSHSELDTVQECLVYGDGLRLCDVGADLLVNHAGVPAAQVSLTSWRDINDEWLAGLGIKRTVISEPTSVKTLVGELCQLGVMFYPDVEAGVIDYAVNSPLGLGQTYYEISDDSNIVEGSLAIERGEDRRVSALIIQHGVIDWTASMTSSSNYAKASVSTVSENPYEQSAIKELFIRWYGRDGDDAAASVVGERLLSRYREPPKVISGKLDVKDREGVNLTSRLSVSSRVLQDENGGGLPELMQVSYAEYTGDDAVNFKAETYKIDGNFGYWMDSAVDEMDYDTATDAEREEGAFWWDSADLDFEEKANIYF